MRCPPLRACIVAARSTKRTLVQTHAHAQCSLARREPNCRGNGQWCHFWGCLRNGRASRRQQQSALRRASARGGSSMCALQPRSPTHSSLVRVAPLDAPHEIVCLWVTMHHSARRQQGYSAAVPHGFGTVAGLLMLRHVTFRPCYSCASACPSAIPTCAALGLRSTHCSRVPGCHAYNAAAFPAHRAYRWLHLLSKCFLIHTYDCS